MTGAGASSAHPGGPECTGPNGGWGRAGLADWIMASLSSLLGIVRRRTRRRFSDFRWHCRARQLGAREALNETMLAQQFVGPPAFFDDGVFPAWGCVPAD